MLSHGVGTYLQEDGASSGYLPCTGSGGLLGRQTDSMQIMVLVKHIQLLHVIITIDISARAKLHSSLQTDRGGRIQKAMGVERDNFF